MDFDLPKMSGTQVTTVIKLQCPETTIIGMKAGIPGDEQYAMVNAGATAVLNKDEIVHVLQPIIIQAVTAAKQAPLLAHASQPR
jgi:CheY-like chemotaxis protein